MTSRDPKPGATPDAEATNVLAVPASGADSSFSPTLFMPHGGEAPATPAPEAPAAAAPAPPAQSSQRPATLPGAKSDGDSPVKRVGRYEILERLGRGGMATVFRARDPSIGRDVAIKFLHASLCEDDDCRMRFLREARAAGGLSHPNIVIVHDVGEIEGRPYMAME